MATDKMITILQKILTLSKQGKIEWDKNPKSDESFSFQANDISITLAKVSTAIYFIVKNNQGVEIGKISSGNATYQSLILELYRLARRKVLKVDETLDTLDKFLDDLVK